jgi:hypothetical protein
MLSESADALSGANDRTEALLRRLPSPALIFTLAVGGVMLAINIAKGFQDPDFFWHFTTGKLIATTGQIPSADPFSFTWAGQPWTLHEWLSELAIYGLVSAAGRIGSLVVFGILPALIFGILVWTLRSHGVRLLAIGLAVALGAWLLVPYVTLRPQAFSWLLLAVLSAFLWTLSADQPRRVLWLVPLFILWANLHGLYAVGLGVVGLYFLFTIARRTPMAGARLWMLGGLVAAFLGSALTPAGPIGLLYPIRYLGVGGGAGKWGLANIAEWQSPNFHDPVNLGVLALMAALLMLGRRGVPGWMAALAYLGVIMSLLAVRNVPLAAVWAVPVIALAFDARLPDRFRPRSRRTSTAVARRGMELLLAVIVVISAVVIVIPHSTGADIDANIAKRFPVKAVDVLEETQPNARVLAEYGWGGYVIYRLYHAGGRVFVDGRNDMYSEQILEDYSAIRNADDGWQQLVNRYGVQAILLPPGAPIVRGAATASGWCEAYRDATQVLLLPSCSKRRA